MMESIFNAAPQLLTDEVWNMYFKRRYSEIAHHLWRYHPPEDRLILLQALALVGESQRLVEEIMRTPDLLEKNTSQYVNVYFPLWGELVSNAQAPILAAVLDTGLVNWSQFIDANGEIKVLHNAYRRAISSEYDDGPLRVVLRDMYRQKIWPEKQLISYLINYDRHIIYVALFDAGFSCQQLMTMADRVAQQEPKLNLLPEQRCRIK